MRFDLGKNPDERLQSAHDLSELLKRSFTANSRQMGRKAILESEGELLTLVGAQVAEIISRLPGDESRELRAAKSGDAAPKLFSIVNGIVSRDEFPEASTIVNKYALSIIETVLKKLRHVEYEVEAAKELEASFPGIGDDMIALLQEKGLTKVDVRACLDTSSIGSLWDHMPVAGVLSSIRSYLSDEMWIAYHQDPSGNMKKLTNYVWENFPE